MAPASLAKVMASQRAVREFSDRPVPEPVLRQLLELATKAPNGSNQQRWRFLVVRDPEQRKRLAAVYQDAMRDLYHAQDLEQLLKRPGLNSMQAGSIRMALDMSRVPPVLVLACYEQQEGYDPAPSIYPAVQNLMLAAWNMGLGSVLITGLRRGRAEPATRALASLLPPSSPPSYPSATPPAPTARPNAAPSARSPSSTAGAPPQTGPSPYTSNAAQSTCPRSSSVNRSSFFR